ncbi:VanZ family protein [Bacillus suaedaesalsae]|uniref:VanZ family protein n=1 Tax=Bacillus suaedaesalsae TaxID=2810349 RepID=A0ABS2DFX3_9BACI|nr:VanZ family protein [Bacillus suaedaesalsae]MBM6617378.1 VanZ family protein [Bacillus suaedaesalsae]
MKYNKLAVWVMFVCYLGLLFYLLFFSAYRNNVKGIIAYNVIPFDSIKNYINHYDGFRISRLTDNFFGNIAAFLPFGFLIPLLFERNNIYLIFLYSFLFSFIIEITQISFRVGAFDVDDMFLNTIGGLIGYVLVKVFLFSRHMKLN